MQDPRSFRDSLMIVAWKENVWQLSYAYRFFFTLKILTLWIFDFTHGIIVTLYKKEIQPHLRMQQTVSLGPAEPAVSQWDFTNPRYTFCSGG